MAENLFLVVVNWVCKTKIYIICSQDPGENSGQQRETDYDMVCEAGPQGKETHRALLPPKLL